MPYLNWVYVNTTAVYTTKYKYHQQKYKKKSAVWAIKLRKSTKKVAQHTPYSGHATIFVEFSLTLSVKVTLNRVLGRMHKATLNLLDLGDLAVSRKLGIGHLTSLLHQHLEGLGSRLHLLLVGRYESH